MTGLRTRLANQVRRVFILTRLDSALAKVTQGVSSRSFLAKLVPGHNLYGRPSIRDIEVNGIKFRLDLSDFMAWCAYFGVAHEPRERLYSLANPGDVVFDVGTNIGETLLNFGKICGKAGSVVGFEVNPVTYRKCKYNIDLNCFGNIQLFNLGLAHIKGELKMHAPTARNTGGDRLSLNASLSGGISVPVTTLDLFMTEKKLSKVNLIKIDVEGFEMNVLRGATRTIGDFLPRLFIELGEINLRAQNSSSRELVGFLEGFGYKIHHAVTQQPVTSKDSFENTHFDIVCTR